MSNQSRKHRGLDKTQSIKPRGFGAWSPEKRFWRSVVKSEDGCWLWVGSTKNKGYGAFRIGKREMLVHRFSYQLHNGAIPSGLFVCHKCDVRNCVNPDHLFLGTLKDNNQDMWRKGRGVTPNNRHGKLNKEQRKDAVARYNKGETKQDIANSFNVTRQAIHYLIKGGEYV